jgi:hypothetical protein
MWEEYAAVKLNQEIEKLQDEIRVLIRGANENLAKQMEVEGKLKSLHRARSLVESEMLGTGHFQDVPAARR